MTDPASPREPERGQPRRRTFVFGRAALGISWDSPEIGEAVEFLFADLPEATEAGAPPATPTLDARGLPGKYKLLRDGDVLWRGRSIAGLSSALLDEAMRDLVGRSRGGAVFHAAAATKRGKCLVIPGESGAGKTSLCAWLLSRGFSYLTDELVYVESSSRQLHGFPRPLHVKRSGYSSILRLLPAAALGGVRATPSGRLVPHRLLSPEYRPQTPEVDLILLPRFVALADCELQPLTKAETGRRLMSCLVNGRNLDGHGFQQATRLARSAEAYALRFGRHDQLSPALDPLLGRHFGP